MASSNLLSEYLIIVNKMIKMAIIVFFIRMGLRGRELVSSIGKIMLQGGGTFGVFMGIGTAIRC